MLIHAHTAGFMYNAAAETFVYGYESSLAAMHGALCL